MSSTDNRIQLDFEVGWKIIYNTGIRRLFEIIHDGMRGRISNKEFVIIYTTVYNMCLQDKSYQHDLYNKFVDTIRDHLLNECKPAIFDNDKHGEYILIELVKQYRSYKFLIKWLIQTFGYLDRQYVKRFHKSPLRKVAVKEFKEIIFSTVKQHCIPVALELIEKDRDNKSIDRTVLRDFISMFIDVKGGDLRTYKEDFERVYLEETTKYYLTKAQTMLHSFECSQYLRECELIIECEQQREIDYLHHSTHSELLKRLYAVLLVGPQMTIIGMDTVCEGGVYQMIKNEDTDSLTLLFKLYSMVPNTLPKICQIVSKRIQDEGSDQLQKAYQQKDTKVFVETLINLYEHHERIICACFKNHADFSKALKDGYCVILNTPIIESVNKNQKSSASSNETKRSICELLSTYIDYLMRVDGGIKLFESEMYARLDALVKLFAYIHDKDIFLEFYRKQLAKRLLTSKSSSEHAEQSFISQLKLRCGAQFTSKLEGMIKDIGRSRTHELQFNRYLSQKSKRSTPFQYEFNCKVLTSGFWPNFSQSSANSESLMLPRSMKKVIDYFQKYFKSLHTKRLLTFVHDLGTVTVMGHFTHKSVMLQVSTLQCCILLILNQISQIKIRDMTRMLGVDATQIKKQLKPLCSKKYKVLLKTPNKGYDVSHALSMNMEWNPSHKRYRIPTGVHRVTVDERKENMSQVFGDRRLMIEASIVRIMKTRKSLKHNLLIANVTQQLMHRFRVNVKDVKQRINDLIEREYLKRDDTDTSTYHYIA